MNHVALGIFDMKKEHAVYPHDQFKPYISISNEDKENLIPKLDISNGESITSNKFMVMTIGIFVDILLRILYMLYPAWGVSV